MQRVNKVLICVLLLLGLAGCQKPKTVSDLALSNNPAITSAKDVAAYCEVVLQFTVLDNLSMANSIVSRLNNGIVTKAYSFRKVKVLKSSDSDLFDRVVVYFPEALDEENRIFVNGIQPVIKDETYLGCFSYSSELMGFVLLDSPLARFSLSANCEELEPQQSLALLFMLLHFADDLPADFSLTALAQSEQKDKGDVLSQMQEYRITGYDQTYTILYSYNAATDLEYFSFASYDGMVQGRLFSSE
ncbi:MAG: hypothetical protein LBR25_02180 [Erysipelotrichaceae bacterium]|jgi:hypothetical protein|nr:hypothetical protein [Erysipelotrichaceae bacterium]